jgi:hypothetical protein
MADMNHYNLYINAQLPIAHIHIVMVGEKRKKEEILKVDSNLMPSTQHRPRSASVLLDFLSRPRAFSSRPISRIL